MQQVQLECRVSSLFVDLFSQIDIPGTTVAAKRVKRVIGCIFVYVALFVLDVVSFIRERKGVLIVAVKACCGQESPPPFHCHAEPSSELQRGATPKRTK